MLGPVFGRSVMKYVSFVADIEDLPCLLCLFSLRECGIVDCSWVTLGFHYYLRQKDLSFSKWKDTVLAKPPFVEKW